MPHTEVWYVSYGSNMCRARLSAYICGGRPRGAATTHVGARDPTMPSFDMPVTLPGRIYFAGESPAWGGGVAFYDHSVAGRTPARAYKLSVEQFADVASQEMHRLPASGSPLETVVRAGLPGGRHELGPGRYETLLEVGSHDGLPMLTFTAAHQMAAVPHTAPQPAYLAMLAEGLRESHGWDTSQIEAYFAETITVAG